MKNFIFKSSLQITDLYKILQQVQAELRHARDDHIQMDKDLRTIVKGVALMISAPEEETEDVPFAPEDNRDRD